MTETQPKLCPRCGIKHYAKDNTALGIKECINYKIGVCVERERILKEIIEQYNESMFPCKEGENQDTFTCCDINKWIYELIDKLKGLGSEKK